MISAEKAKEFAQNYLQTLKNNGKKNKFRSVREIAQIMKIEWKEASHLIASALTHGYMEKDVYDLPAYACYPSLFQVLESHL